MLRKQRLVLVNRPALLLQIFPDSPGEARVRKVVQAVGLNRQITSRQFMLPLGSRLNALQLTRDMLNYNTVNPPGIERACAQHVGKLLEDSGEFPAGIAPFGQFVALSFKVAPRLLFICQCGGCPGEVRGGRAPDDGTDERQ